MVAEERAAIALEHVSKRFGRAAAVNDVSTATSSDARQKPAMTLGERRSAMSGLV